MVHSSTLTVVASLFLLPSALAAGLYGKGSGVLNVDGQSYRRLIEKSNHTSIVEFYAPWCGHCKNLQPQYEKAAKSLDGLAKVAAVNCDAEENKPFCGSMGVQGFPTLKIVRPGKGKGKPVVEDYQGARTAKAITEAVKDKIPNHVSRLKDSEYEKWLEDGDGPKAILFSDKGTVSPMLKAIAVDFLGSLKVAQIKNKETQAVEVFGVEKYPTLVLLPSGEGKDPVYYDGEIKKDAIVTFLSQAASPNPDPPAKVKKESTKTDKSKASKASSSFSKTSASHASSEAQAAQPSQIVEELDDDAFGGSPTPSPNPRVDDSEFKPIALSSPPIPSLPDGLSLQQRCLNTKAGTCVLALLPPVGADTPPSLDTINAIATLSEIKHKATQADRALFPIYQLPSTNSQAGAIRSKLPLKSSEEDTVIVAINGKRSWYIAYAPSPSVPDITSWIDSLRTGDLSKSTLPSGLVIPAENLPEQNVVVDEEAGPNKGKKKEFDADKPMRIDREGLQAMKEAFARQMPKGMEVEIEEYDEDEDQGTVGHEDLNALRGGGHEEL